MHTTSTPRRRLLLGACAATVAAVGVHTVSADNPVVPVTPAPKPAVEHVASHTPSVSADGRFVVYAGATAALAGSTTAQPPASTPPTDTTPGDTTPSDTTPAAGAPSTTDPATSAPASTDPAGAVPSSSVPTSTDPTSTDPTATVPGTSDPTATTAGATTEGSQARTSTVFLTDRADGKVTELTTAVDGVRTGDSVWPVISADGCTVAVITQMAYDLFRDDDIGSRWDVYEQRLPHCGGVAGDWQLVSTAGNGGFDSSAADDVSPLYSPAISTDGTLVAYTHQFDPGTPDLTGINLVDLAVPLGTKGRLAPVEGSPAALPDSLYRFRGLREPTMSDDGNVVAFTSDAASASPMRDWGTGTQPGGYATSQVFVWDRTDLDPNTNVREVSTPGADDPGEASSPALAGNGESLAFVSTATTLDTNATLPPCTPDCLPQVYLYQLDDASVRLASRTAGKPGTRAVAASTGAGQPALNTSGDELLYISRAPNLFPTRSGSLGAPNDGDVVLSVPSTGTVERVSLLADGITPAPAVNSHPHMSANGRVVVFDTLAGPAFGGPRVQGRQVAVLSHAPVLDMADLDVGTVAVGYPGPEWFLTLTNHGPGSFVPASVTIDNTDFLISGGTCVEHPGTPVPPGAACTVNLMLMPTVAGLRGGVLTVSEHGFEAATVTASVVGMGGEPALASQPGGAEAKPLVVGGRSEPMSFMVENVSFAPVVVTSVTLAGSNPDDFSISGDQCTDQALDASMSCAVDVVFNPTAAGRRTATVVVDTDAGAYTTMLVSGTAHYEPKLAVTSTTIVTPSRVAVVGTGFAPGALVTVSWADGQGHSFTATTDAKGSFMAGFVVRVTDRPGPRRLVAQTTDGQVATADVRVVSPRGSAGRWAQRRQP